MRKSKVSGNQKEFDLNNVIIQAKLGGSISVAEIKERTERAAKDSEIAGDVVEIYIKPEENRAYWVASDSGNNTGSVVLWD